MKCLIVKEPPGIPPTIATGFLDDESNELGERIMGLTLSKVVSLSRYLRTLETVKEGLTNDQSQNNYC